jgi:hypothetical protein
VYKKVHSQSEIQCTVDSTQDLGIRSIG